MHKFLNIIIINFFFYRISSLNYKTAINACLVQKLNSKYNGTYHNNLWDKKMSDKSDEIFFR